MKFALAQLNQTIGDLPGNARRILDACERAQAAGARGAGSGARGGTSRSAAPSRTAWSWPSAAAPTRPATRLPGSSQSTRGRT
jgi:hypothetical protein